MLAYLSLECRALKDVIEKSINTSDKAGACQLSDGTICHERPPGLQDIVAEQRRYFVISRISDVMNQ